MKFLRNLLAAIIGFFIAFLLLFFIFAGVVSTMTSKDEVIVKPNSVLELDLPYEIKDYAPKSDDPIKNLLNLTEEKLALNKIITAIENAKTDDNIKGISIFSGIVTAGMAQTQAIRNKLQEFKESGKFIYAYNDNYFQKSYYLSSVADSLFLNPVGAIDFKGLSTEVMYYKNFEDKYGLKMEVIRHGKYKSAVEPYLTNTMSEANREQVSSLLHSVWSEITSAISKNRGVSVEQLNAIANNSYGRNATLAQKHNLIDDDIYEDEYEEKLKLASNTQKLNYISISDYIASGKGRKASVAKNKIAVIYAQGAIMYGEGNEKYIGQGIINKAIKKVVKAKNVKAIVLRVNSPGGSALASELIWRELQLAKQQKPLVVSMGNAAASGGYYIACNADKIIAEPTTITGSIGVFGMLPNAYEFSKNIGINAEQVSTNTGASYSLFEPMTEKFYDLTQEGVETIYETFLNRVANGRNMTVEQVNEIAQGRVWTGKQAIKNGLVDQLGSLEDAIKVAAELAKVDNYRVRNYPSYKTELKESLKLNPFITSQKEEILREALGEESFRLYNTINSIKKAKGIQARMPYVLDIK